MQSDSAETAAVGPVRYLSVGSKGDAPVVGLSTFARLTQGLLLH